MGGTLNRTGYWTPVFIYHCPTSIGGCDTARNGEPNVARRFNAYYKTNDETHGKLPQWPPEGLRMIAGDPNNTNPANLGGHTYFECWVNGTTPGNPFVNTTNSYRFDHLPTSAEGIAVSTYGGYGSLGCTSILMEVVLPQCMSTAMDLDDPVTHKAHMAYASDSGPSGPAGMEGCTNPLFQGRQIPNISVLVHTPVLNADLDHTRLSSDWSRAQAIADGLVCATSAKNYCAGQSAHADWVNGWDQTTVINGFGEKIADLIIRECYYVANTEFRSCSNGVLGDKDKNGVYWLMY
jgi:Truncated, possibly inactive, lysyl-tRNA synthetase (class II)